VRARSLLTPLVFLLAGLTTCGPTTPSGDPAKETIPLAEPDGRERLRDARGDFDDCLDGAGYEFRGFAGDEGDQAVIEDPAYQEALRRCSAETGVTELRDELQESRNTRTPEQVRSDNEVVLAVVDCLRGKGLELDDPVQDESGALNLRQTLMSSEVNPRDDERARDCVSEIGFARRAGG